MYVYVCCAYVLFPHSVAITHQLLEELLILTKELHHLKDQDTIIVALIPRNRGFGAKKDQVWLHHIPENVTSSLVLTHGTPFKNTMLQETIIRGDKQSEGEEDTIVIIITVIVITMLVVGVMTIKGLGDLLHMTT